MKKVLLLSSLIILAGCGTVANANGERVLKVDVYQDAYYGCEYLQVNHAGLTPRLNKAGEHVGCTK